MNAFSKLASPWQLFIATELRTAAKCFQEVHHTLSLVHNWLKAGSKNTKTAVDFNLLQTLAENQVRINIFIFPLVIQLYISDTRFLATLLVWTTNSN